MKLSKIKPNPNNPRVIRDERFKKLVQSIKDFPKMMEMRPMIIDEDNVILGGNMRYMALQFLGYKEISDNWVMKFDDLTEEQKDEFIIKDNNQFGDYDWELIQDDWLDKPLESWGVDFPGFEYSEDEMEINLPTGSKEPFQQMTFTLSDKQVQVVKNAMKVIKQSEDFNNSNFDNKNSNGNAIYLIVKQWVEQNK